MYFKGKKSEIYVRSPWGHKPQFKKQNQENHSCLCCLTKGLRFFCVFLLRLCKRICEKNRPFPSLFQQQLGFIGKCGHWVFDFGTLGDSLSLFERHSEIRLHFWQGEDPAGLKGRICSLGASLLGAIFPGFFLSRDTLTLSRFCLSIPCQLQTNQAVYINPDLLKWVVWNSFVC